ncbi:toprim domain-containing protein [Macrococcus armenti]|uniref:toprim domain-containing protein n=1 Tax=Macrococcus armenti TaxID=2875764 RepID=UPI001CC916A0|nr:toprim domain-containing protein [Macrococcus armenti]UBH21932.1 toprim domain-containing protein [Macrococcus armenti]
MATIYVNGRYIDVDIREEVEEYDWYNAKWTEDKLIACSPFRDDSKPSFWLHLNGERSGVFGDSAYEDDYYRSGTFPKLLAFLRDESYEETCAYLLEKYDYDYMDGDIELSVANAKIAERMTVSISENEYDKPIDTEYLIGRGIHPRVIEMNGVFDNGDNVGIPWRSTNGVVSAIKYRHKRSKYFWYAEDGKPLGELVYGLDIVIKRGIKRAVICEAEIDAMTWQSAGIMAIAIGGARLNEYQADMIVMSGLEEIIVAGDNDRQGHKFNDKCVDLLRNKIELYRINYSDMEGAKDVNELGIERLKRVRINPVKETIISI